MPRTRGRARTVSTISPSSRKFCRCVTNSAGCWDSRTTRTMHWPHAWPRAASKCSGFSMTWPGAASLPGGRNSPIWKNSPAASSMHGTWHITANACRRAGSGCHRRHCGRIFPCRGSCRVCSPWCSDCMGSACARTPARKSGMQACATTICSTPADGPWRAFSSTRIRAARSAAARGWTSALSRNRCHRVWRSRSPSWCATSPRPSATRLRC